MPKQRPRAVVELFPGRPKSFSWYEDTYSVLELGKWLEDRGALEPLPAGWEQLFSKPWHFEQEYSEYRRSLLVDPDDDGPRAA
jgi:hypothetical protein